MTGRRIIPRDGSASNNELAKDAPVASVFWVLQKKTAGFSSRVNKSRRMNRRARALTKKNRTRHSSTVIHSMPQPCDPQISAFTELAKAAKTRNMMTNFSKLLNWTKLVNYWVRKFSNSKLQHIFNKCSLCLMLALIRLHIIKFIYTIELQFNSGELMVYSVFSFFEKSLRSREYLGVKILNSYFLNILKLF